ncbi:MAG TPA: hypothetical protein DEW32_14100 [Dehalococcoidia bacterium]|nr:hypothetical protein [Dehalococcoidia bacterium]
MELSAHANATIWRGTDYTTACWRCQSNYAKWGYIDEETRTMRVYYDALTQQMGRQVTRNTNAFEYIL